MTWFATAMLYAWLPIVLAMFVFFPPRRAVVIAVIASWLFLPQLTIGIPLFPNYTKITATSYGILFGALLLDPDNRLLAFRFKWIDLPMLIWCVVPFVSSMTNGLGAYDGISSLVDQVILYGFPYLIGRIYFSQPKWAGELTMGIVVGTLIYVPLCLFEMRMSPQLHRIVYGFSPYTDWLQAQRMGGWRPTVFLQHGLAAAIWMAAGAALATWLWMTRAVRSILGVPLWLIAPALIVVAIFMRSANAVVMMSGVLVAMASLRYLHVKWVLHALMASIVVYLALRTTLIWEGLQFAQWLGDNVLERRGASLEYRYVNENAITARTWERPLLGWGGYGRSIQVNLPEMPVAVPDSFWINAFGNYGFVGLFGLVGSLLLPGWVLLRKMSVRAWCSRHNGPATGLVMITLLYLLDGLLNAMINPVFIVAAGSLASIAINYRPRPADQAAQARQAMGPARPRGPRPLHETPGDPSGALSQ